MADDSYFRFDDNKIKYTYSHNYRFSSYEKWESSWKHTASYIAWKEI